MTVRQDEEASWQQSRLSCKFPTLVTVKLTLQRFSIENFFENLSQSDRIIRGPVRGVIRLNCGSEAGSSHHGDLGDIGDSRTGRENQTAP